MRLVNRKLLTIIADQVLEDTICSELDRRGCRGYSAVPVKGQGSEASHKNELEGKSIRIETVVTEELALSLIEYISSSLLNRYSIVCFLQDVQVVRADRF